jgi:hypothetical protein
MPPFVLERITIELVSAIFCFILMRFMIKPFRLTGEARYLGLPIGFGFLGLSYLLSAFLYSPLFTLHAWTNFGWVQVLIRGFAFIFLAATYYFSKSEKKLRFLWSLVLSCLLIIMTFLILFAIISPEITQSDYLFYYIISRVAGLACLGYISIHALKSHAKLSDSTTLLTPVGYILIAIDQYSSIIWRVDRSYLALFGGLSFRLAGLVIFLYVLYKGFYSTGNENE